MKRGEVGSVPVPVPEPHAILPLTVFDQLHERTTFVLGWLVEGEIDLAALEGALTRLTRKWRILSGRIEMFKANKERQWRLRVPLGEFPQNFQTFAFSSATSEVPLSIYIPDLGNNLKALNPFRPGLSDPSAALNALFVHPSTPRGYAAFESKIHPLTCWHVTHFPASLSETGSAYTCIGFSRCGIFDDVGATLILRALTAEMGSRPWPTPPVPTWGVNDNPLQRKMESEKGKFQVPLPGDREYVGYSSLTFLQTGRTIFWHLKQKELKGAGPRSLYLRSDSVASTLDETRQALKEQGRADAAISDADIMFAWVISSLYNDKIKRDILKKRIAVNNLASFRPLFLSDEESLENYPFNASIPVPCPVLTMEEISAFSIADLARTLAVWRSTFSRTHVLLTYEKLQTSSRAFPFNPTADETMSLADLTECQFAEMDWRHIGAWLTLGLSHFHLTTDNVMWTNSVSMIGKSPDGGILLDSILSDLQLRKLEVKATSVSLPSFSAEHDFKLDFNLDTKGNHGLLDNQIGA